MESGRLERLRVGWFALPASPQAVKDAHRVGGRPACVTVADLHGLWLLDRRGLHVEVTDTQSRLRSPAGTDLRLHWTEHPDGSERRGQPLVTALAQMSTCLSRLEVISAIDSALHRRLVSVAQLSRAMGSARNATLGACDGRAESGVESIFRVRASEAGYVFRTQVPTGGWRLDFLFGDRLAVEVDGSEFHSGHEAFVRDRERDAWHAAVGYHVLRFTYDQVIYRWHEVASVLQLMHSRGEHLGRSRIRR